MEPKENTGVEMLLARRHETLLEWIDSRRVRTGPARACADPAGWAHVQCRATVSECVGLQRQDDFIAGRPDNCAESDLLARFMRDRRARPVTRKVQEAEARGRLSEGATW